MDVDHLPAGDEGVDRRIVNQHDIDIAGAQPRRFDQRIGHVAQQCLGFRIAQNALRHGRLRHQRGGRQECDQTDQGTVKRGHVGDMLAFRGLNVS